MSGALAQMHGRLDQSEQRMAHLLYNHTAAIANFAGASVDRIGQALCQRERATKRAEHDQHQTKYEDYQEPSA